MGWLKSLFGLTKDAEDERKTANKIYARAVHENRKLTLEEIKQLKKLGEIPEDKKDQRWTGLG